MTSFSRSASAGAGPPSRQSIQAPPIHGRAKLGIVSEAPEAPADCPFGIDLQKYWDRRHSLFHRFDEGIQVDAEGLYSAKPEESALRIAEALGGRVVLDAFCGVGGSAIGFARHGSRVLSVDTEATRLEMARHNARVYGVSDRIEFVLGDCRDFLRAADFDAVYFDPPWGGPEYSKRPRFPLEGFEPDGRELLRLAFEREARIGFTVPPNFDLMQVCHHARDFEVLCEAVDRVLSYYTILWKRPEP